MIEIDEAYESAELALRLRLWEFIDGLDFLRSGRNTVAINGMSQEVE